MVKSGTVYSGRKYSDNLNIIYKSFNIDMSELPVVMSQSKKKNHERQHSHTGKNQEPRRK
jgi:hypothetical protein